MRTNAGFSLIELLIVVAIILIVAAIAIPSLLQARISANEASAASSIRQIKTAETAYHTTYTTVGYAPALSNLGGTPPCVPPTSVQACLIDDSLALAAFGTAGKSGYVFAATGIATAGALNDDFVAAAVPMMPSKSGNRDFCGMSDMVIRYQLGAGGAPINTLGACRAFPGIL
jgi:prepilin-type N-terminal cleavage/methylation domain-containing protein